MSISERVGGTIENWSAMWKDRLKGWMASILSFGFEVFMDVLGKSFSPKLEPLINRLEQSGEVPPELQPILNEIKNPTGEVGAILAQSAGGAIVGGAIGSVIDALFLQFAYAINRMFHPRIPTEAQLIAMWLRDIIPEDKLTDYLHSLGCDDVTVTTLKELSHPRLDPNTVLTAWRRDKEGYEWLLKDLEHQGLDPARIAALKFATLFYPSPQDLINWQAKEVYEPKMREKYGLEDELSELEREPFYKAGVGDEQIANYWVAHWIHPAFREITDMLHRGLITDQDVYDWYRLVEIPPYWRNNLTAISWDLPNRIELRMMARYGLVDKQFLVDQLEKVGLQEEYRSIAADMMLAMGIRTDIAARYSKGWLNASEVRMELEKSGLDPQVVERMYMWIVQNNAGDRVAKEKDLTVTDIYRGVKKNTITRQEAQQLLVELGYDDKEAAFKLAVNVPTEEEMAASEARSLTKTEVIKAYKLGQIDRAEATQRLVEIRYKPEDAEFLLQLTDATMSPIAEDSSRSLTKTDIIKGVKGAIVSQVEAFTMLRNIGYSDNDANFILAINPTVPVGSPDTFSEFNAIAQSYRASQDLPTRPIPLELIQAERDLKAAQAALKVAKDKKLSAKRIKELEALVEDAKMAYHQLMPQGESES